MDVQPNSQSKINWFNFGTLAISIIAMLITARGIDTTHKDFEKSLTKQNIKDSLQRVDDILRSYRDSFRFEKQVKLAIDNQTLVEKQTDLANKELNLYIQQTLIAKNQLAIVQNEIKTKQSENYFRLREIFKEVENLLPYYGQDSIRVKNDFAKAELRAGALKNIKDVLVKEMYNSAILNNDTIFFFWSRLHGTTNRQLKNCSEKELSRMSIITNQGLITDKQVVQNMILDDFWYYILDFHKTLNILNLLVDSKSKNMRIAVEEKKGNALVVRLKYDIDSIYNELYRNKIKEY